VCRLAPSSPRRAQAHGMHVVATELDTASEVSYASRLVAWVTTGMAAGLWS